MTTFVVEMNRFRVRINIIRLLVIVAVVLVVGAVKWSRRLVGVLVAAGVMIVDGRMVRAVIDATRAGVIFVIVLIMIILTLVTLIRYIVH